MFTATKGKALLTTTTGALPRPGWYTANLRGMPLSYGLSQAAYREQHFDCLACNVIAQHRAGIDILVDGDARLDDDVAGRSWVSYATERIAGIGKPRVEVPPAHFMADKGPGDLMWEVIETRMTPPVEGAIALAPSNFGELSNTLLIGNFGDGTIHGFNPATGALVGGMDGHPHQPLVITGLWGLTFGNGGQGGDPDKLYFTAGIPGPDEVEDHGLFGSIEAKH